MGHDVEGIDALLRLSAMGARTLDLDLHVVDREERRALVGTDLAARDTDGAYMQPSGSSDLGIL